MSNQLAVRDDMSLADTATHFVKSGLFQDATDVSKAIVKIMAGREFGFGAFTSMTNIHIIKGRPSLGANLMASAVKGSARYDYRIRQMDEKACSVEFFERVNGKLESIGTSTFTIDDARKAGTQNLDKFPRNMLFARAISNGVKWYTPDVFGAAVYVPEELGAPVNEDGDIIPGSFTMPTVTVYPTAEQQPAPEPPPAAQPNGHKPEDAEPEPVADAKKYVLKPGTSIPVGIMEAGYAENTFEASNILNMMPTKERSGQKAMDNAAKYHALRVAGKSTDEAKAAMGWTN